MENNVAENTSECVSYTKKNQNDENIISNENSAKLNQQLNSLTNKTEFDNEIFLLFDNYDAIIDDLNRILSVYYKFNVWPKYSSEQLLSEHFNLMNTYKLDTINDMKNKIKHSKMIICIVNQQFINSKNCNELFEYSKNLNKPIITFIIEAVESIKYENQFEVYKERVNETGFDYWLWMSDIFESAIQHISQVLNKKFVSIFIKSYFK